MPEGERLPNADVAAPAKWPLSPPPSLLTQGSRLVTILPYGMLVLSISQVFRSAMALVLCYSSMVDLCITNTLLPEHVRSLSRRR
jgi:hypothetical protein